jgi:hypothetical protein
MEDVEVSLRWTGKGLEFKGGAEGGPVVRIDGDKQTGASPMQALLLAKGAQHDAHRLAPVEVEDRRSRVHHDRQAAVAGAVVIAVPISPWLYVCTILLALFIGFGKRRNELDVLQSEAVNHRRNLANYSLPLLDQFILIVAAAAVMAYSLYTFYSPAVPEGDQMMLTIPFVIYGLFRYLYLVHRKGGGGAPETMILEDKPLLLTVLLWGVLTVLIMYQPWS